jgi:uncharacterized membrane protein YeaQ/YmgE (transglycosylase-associated protein family)
LTKGGPVVPGSPLRSKPTRSSTCGCFAASVFFDESDHGDRTTRPEFLGLIAGRLLSKHGEGFGCDLLLGVGGAVLGGWLFNRVSAAGVTGLNTGSLLLAVVGAVVLLVA